MARSYLFSRQKQCELLKYIIVEKFFPKNLTGCRSSDFVSDMETKILNKKVSCALIAASLLAASSVQGSGVGYVGQVCSLSGMNLYIPDGGRVRANFPKSCTIAFNGGDLVSRLVFRGDASARGLETRNYILKVRGVPFMVSVSDDLRVALSPDGEIIVLPQRASHYEVTQLIATMGQTLDEVKFFD
ncbi:MAG: hypothetical protein LBD60_04490 [Puniceicoccales bacterium]|jgi:hypothetical protein|nr:hypothetical protein [Puniceicoccales bacterium]